MSKFIDTDKIVKVIAVNKKSILMLLVLAGVVFVWAFFLSSRETTYNILVWDNWSNFITVLTFIVAITIGWLDYVRGWQESLPHKLTVHFYYEKDKDNEPNVLKGDEGYIMSAYTVSLSSKSDLRAWAQQIGKQMVGGKESLNFQLTHSQKYLGIINNQFKHYEVTYYLSTEPKVFKQNNFKNQYLTWIIEDNDNESKGDIKQRKHNRQNTPLSREEAKTQGEEYL